MGCCLSRSSGPNSPYPGGAPNASSRAINPPPLSLPEAAQPQISAERRRQHRRSNRPLDQHIDKPLRRHEWTSRDRNWTKSELAKERAAFFDTRVTGRLEIWQTIHAALAVLWDPASQDAQDDGSNGLATAQMILSAAEISLPTGNLSNGVYDSLGNYYQLPEWVVCDPQNVQEDREEGTKGDLSTAGDDTAADEDMSDEEIEGKKQEKGKEVDDVRELVKLRARLSENGQDIKVSISESESVKSVAKKIALEAGLASTKKIRIAYMGKILKDNLSLTAQNWQTGHIVNALVFDA
ncbi:Ubiquitin domain-containing protein 2 [Fusarium austroafricanum]|uniref:Ubiquitin domain-containing protein 2 n=1 Tax=Fusarium austroafricanum TaxID=2364996 RepID=A0A8H4PAP1_9HYPO|nr:Ubiquitin domain-containing protein 2 [Fusarium austroafricanum]